MSKGTILSGMRPTGRIHLGNYVGALENWVNLQKDYKNYHMVADWHVLTTGYEDTSEIGRQTREMVIDWIAAGIDPEKSPIFVQSRIKEHSELHLLFSMLVTTARLERNPTVKEQVKDLNLEDRISYGLLGYPILQAADILMYKADVVPVGEDQAPHVELTREIARRFNSLYGEVFPEPDSLLTPFARLSGTDGKRMSKSVGNTILISDSSEQISKKVYSTITDPQKIYKNDPGRPDICTVFTYHKKFNPPETEQIRADCTSGALGCVDCKQNLSNKLTIYFEPIREKRAQLESKSSYIDGVLNFGNESARKVSQDTMRQVHEAMKIG